MHRVHEADTQRGTLNNSAFAHLPLPVYLIHTHTRARTLTAHPFYTNATAASSDRL